MRHPLLRLRLRHPLRGYPDTYDKDDEEEDYPFGIAVPRSHIARYGARLLAQTAKFRKAKLAISAVRRTSIMHYALCIMH